jgi:exoribonuclease-2
MNIIENSHHRTRLQKIARRAMLERGLVPDFPSEALAELEMITQPAPYKGESVRDLRSLLWCSIDNDDSRDLDQLTVAEALADGAVKVLVAVADVDVLVKNGSAIDARARQNTTSVYTATEIFPMLPEKLSTDLTSLNHDSDRLAIVVEMIFAADGSLQDSDIYRAVVRNRARLSYNSLADWLEDDGSLPRDFPVIEGLEENLRLQDQVARKLKTIRHLNGALDFETIQAHPVFDGEELRDLEVDSRNRAKDIIQDFMIAANGVVARYLSSRKMPLVRRVVHTPRRWDRIVEMAEEMGSTLPSEPDAKALEEFLAAAKEADPVRFPDLSLSVVKLLGRGEYALQLPEEESDGHFSLAVNDYVHSTAPNRRYLDLVTQRLLKASFAAGAEPYGKDELDKLAKHCSAQESAVNKVERQVNKAAAAILLESRIGEQFEAIVTGSSSKGTWVRLLHPPVEGRLEKGFEGMDVGRRLSVRLVRTNVELGHIDFERVG